MVRRSMKRGYTKRGYTKRRNTNRRSTKRRSMKRRNKKNRTRRKMRGGTGHDKSAQHNAKFRARMWREERERKQRENAILSTNRSSRQSAASQHDLSFNILNKFFKKEAGWFGRISYKLNMPNDKIYLISAHGGSIPNQFFVIPEGLTLYLSIPGGKRHYSFTSSSKRDRWVSMNHPYIREYSGGSLIQDYDISFSPFYGGEHSDKYANRGLLMCDAPRITAKNANEANKELIKFLMRGPLAFRVDELKEKDRAVKTGNTGEHLKDYAQRYFQNNIDDIISKDELIYYVIGSRIPLSEILGRIAEKKESNGNISGEWFGTFCRSGDFIDIDKFNECSESGLPKLTAEFFEGNFHYEGITSELTKQKSLAANNPTINFKQILDEVYKKHVLGVGDITERVKLIKQHVENNQSISFEDVCFVFQLKQKLIEQSQ